MAPRRGAYRTAVGLLVAVAAIPIACTGSSAPTTGVSPSSVPADWPTYTDQRLGFSIRHPGTYVVRTQGPSAGEPVAIDAPGPGVPVDPETYRKMKEAAKGGEIRLEDTRQAGSAPAVIEVFLKLPDMSLRQWLDMSGSIAAGATVQPVQLAGAGEGLRVSSGGAIGETWYFAQPRNVYGLTLEGPYSGQILSSFRLSAIE